MEPRGRTTAAAVHDDHRARLAAALTGREADVVRRWWQLGVDGPTLGSPSAGAEPAATERYLVPLARTLRGALLGSHDHLSVYLDERTRYGDSISDIRRALDVELPALARILDPGVVDESLEVLRTLHAPLLTDRPSGPRVLFVGDCLFVEIRAFVRAAFSQRSTAPEIEHIFFSTQQGMEDVEGATAAAIREFRPDLIGLSLFTFDAVPLFKAALYDNAAPWRAPDLSLVPPLVATLASELESIRRVTDATVVVHSPSGIPLDRFRRRLPAVVPPHSRAQRRLLDTVRAEVADLVEATENAVLLDEHALVEGRTRAHAGPLFPPSDVPEGYFHTTRLGPVLAREYAHLVDSVDLLGGAKALFVDFDNTLWSGVMAEGDVVHEITGQRLLKELKEAGVLLVALSKNDESAIRWDEMELSPDDFVLRKINWSPKPDNVAAAVAELDLAPQAFVLLDDNPVERTLVSESVPGVRTLDPASPRVWDQLRAWLSLPSTKRTAEAAARTEMYRQAAERREAVAGTRDYPTMMRSLDLRSTVRPATLQDMDRLLELVQRTNQFNTTTLRRSSDELGRMLDDRETGVWAATLSDRFGDLGIVALAVLDRRRRMVDSFVMSCRAMGFALETAFLRTVLEQESTNGFSPVEAQFRPTDRNRPAAGLFRDHGFDPIGEGVWRLADLDACPEVPSWLAVRVSPTTSRA